MTPNLDFKVTALAYYYRLRDALDVPVGLGLVCAADARFVSGSYISFCFSDRSGCSYLDTFGTMHYASRCSNDTCASSDTKE